MGGGGGGLLVLAIFAFGLDGEQLLAFLLVAAEETRFLKLEVAERLFVLETGAELDQVGADRGVFGGVIFVSARP